MKDKIKWNKPDYNHWGRVSNKEIDKMCEEGSSSTGDIIIHKEQNGRNISFIVYRVEKIGTLIEGIETLSRQRLIEELQKCRKQESEESK